MPTTEAPILDYSQAEFTRDDKAIGGRERERRYKNRELEQQQILAKYQQDLDEYWWNKNAEWNSPIQQRQRYAEAGYNDHLAIGGNSPQNSLGTNAPSVPNTNGSNAHTKGFERAISGLQMASMAMDEYIRIQKGLGQIEEQEIRNMYLPDMLNSTIQDRNWSKELKIYRGEAQQMVNKFLPQNLQVDYDIAHSAWEMGYASNAEKRLQIIDRVAEMLAAGFSEDEIKQVLTNYNMNEYYTVRNGKYQKITPDFSSSYYNNEYKALEAEQSARIANASMNTKLNTLGLHEGDDPYLRTQAIDGLSRRAAKAVTAGDKVLDAALSMVSIGTKIAGVRQAGKLGRRAHDLRERQIEYDYDLRDRSINRKRAYKYQDGDKFYHY